MSKRGKMGSGRRKPAASAKLRDIVERAKRKTRRKKQRERLEVLRRKQAERRKARQERPLPRPRRATRSQRARPAVATTASAKREISPELQARVDRLEDKFGRVDQAAELGGVYSEVGDIEKMLAQLPIRLDKLRERGYVHSGKLENYLEDLDAEWDDIRPRVERMLKENVARLDDEMDALERRMKQLARPSESRVERLETAVEQMDDTVSTVERNVGELYRGIWEGVYELAGAVDKLEWMLDQIEQSPEIALYSAEGPLLAVEAEWERDGEDEGPDGILYLTDQRLLFEQKEEMAKKKFLFVTTEKEKIQALLLDVPVREIQSIAHEEEGRGFLSLRKDDILELVLSHNAPVSRARFHLKGQESADWAAFIKRVQSGEIDEDRHDAFVEEMEAAAAATASLPERCPNCFADVPPQPRGVMSYTCEFCGTEITAEALEEE